MAMKMLEAGGMPILTDGSRPADAHNPKGYYELEAVKQLDKGGDQQWLRAARGKAVKIVSFLLTWLPETNQYRVIFMERDLDEVVASQNKMLLERGGPDTASADARTAEMYRRHLDQVFRFVASRRCFSLLRVSYREAVQNPVAAARQMNAFLGNTLDVRQMAAVADESLYRNRAVERTR
jgi:hypothetical protein